MKGTYRDKFFGKHNTRCLYRVPTSNKLEGSARDQHLRRQKSTEMLVARKRSIGVQRVYVSNYTELYHYPRQIAINETLSSRRHTLCDLRAAVSKIIYVRKYRTCSIISTPPNRSIYDYLLVIVLKIKSHSAAAHDDKCRLAYLYTYFFTYRIRPYSVHTTHTQYTYRVSHYQCHLLCFTPHVVCGTSVERSKLSEHTHHVKATKYLRYANC